MAYILAGVGNIQLFSPMGDLMLASKTLSESTFSIAVTAEDIRGGLSNPLLGKYFHDSIMDANITDALFSLEYLSLVVGGAITIGGDAIADEQVVTTTANEITVTGTPVKWGDVGTIGWYTLPNEENWKKITFVGKTATVAGLAIGTTVCVKFNATNSALREFIVPSSIIPSECRMVLTAPLFQANAKSFTSSSQVGELIVDVPRFILNGSTDLTMTATGASTTNLSGSALAAFGVQANCNDMGTYATVKENIYGKDWTENLQTLAVVGADIQLATGGTSILKVISVYNDNTTGSPENSDLTFTSGTPATATVSNAGLITAVATGTSQIKIVATSKPDIECFAEVTVA